MKAAAQPGLRPRVEGDREDAIIDGILQVLIEVGYDKLTFDLVATRVRASKATLYRRWPTKAELVMGALSQIKMCPNQEPDALDTGSLAGDLEQLACSDPEWTRLVPDIVGAIVPALHRDPDLTAAFSETFMRPRLGLMRGVLERAQARGEIGAEADLDQLGRILPALAIYHTLVTGSGPDIEASRAAIVEVLLPACRATLRSAAGPPDA